MLDERSNGLAPMAKRPQPLLPAGSGGLHMEQRLLGIRRQKDLVSFVRFDPTAETFNLVPLSRQNMVGLGSLLGLARSQGAVAAINGGFFNRIQALPLGGLRDDGDWLSGPILDRGAIAWAPQELPQFSRVRLNETLVSDAGERIELNAINSGWVKREWPNTTVFGGPATKRLRGEKRQCWCRANKWRAALATQNSAAELVCGAAKPLSWQGAEPPCRSRQAMASAWSGRWCPKPLLSSPT